MIIPAGAPRLDVALALQRIVTVFWHDFAPIVVLGFVMSTIPQVLLALVGSHSGSTITAMFGGMLRVLYVVIVTHGTLARLNRHPLGAQTFVRAGIAASPQGLSVALLLGAAVVVLLVGLLLAGLAGPLALVVQSAVLVTGFAAAVVVAPAVPVALVERLTPLPALARAAMLTRGSRGGVAVVLAVFVLTVIPARMVIAASVYGVWATPDHVAAVDAAMTVFSPGLWLLALFDLLAWAVGAVMPGVVYAGLVRDLSGRPSPRATTR